MDEELFEVEEDTLDVPEDASSYSEFSPVEASGEAPYGRIEDADFEDSQSEAESAFGGGIGYTIEMGEQSRPGEEGFFVWEGGVYEESVYGGEFSRYEESEDESQVPVKAPSPTKSSSRVVVQVPSTASSSSSLKKSTSKTKSSSGHRLRTSSSSRLKTVRQQEKPCVRDRMRKWLNRDPTVEPHQESFLGVPYSEREQRLDTEDPCRSLYFGKEKHVSKTVGFNEEHEVKRHLCACKLKSWEPYKSPDPTESKRDIVTSSVAFKKPSASLMSVTEASPEICRCGRTSSNDTLSLSSLLKAKPGSSARIYDHKRNEVLKRLGICTCGQEPKQPDNEIPGGSQINRRMRKKIHKLVLKLLETKKCHCRKTGWMSSQRWPRKKQKCICKNMKKRQRRLQETINRMWERERDRQAELEVKKMKEQRIEQLYKAIGPQLAAKYRQMAASAKKKGKPPKNEFTKKMQKEFGSQIQKYKLKSLEDGTVFTHYDMDDFESFQYLELPSGSVYYGQFSPLGMEGHCIYKMSHGPIFVGTMVDGKMEGPGRLIYPNGGRVDGIFVSGALFEPKYTFSDGLQFEPTGWKYCRMPDRRFVSEIIKGMNSPDNVQLCANHPARQIPKGCLDAGEGFYDPQKKIIIHPSTGKTIRIVNEHEGQWILKNCRREWFEEVPFSRHMYENWYAGTVFAPPLDEADWFAEEFPKVLLPYNDVDDVIQARRIAAMNALQGSSESPDDQPHEPENADLSGPPN